MFVDYLCVLFSSLVLIFVFLRFEECENRGIGWTIWCSVNSTELQNSIHFIRKVESVRCLAVHAIFPAV